MLILLFFILPFTSSQTIKQLNEISINEELPIGSIITYLTDKIPNLDQSLEYDLVTPVSADLDLFSIDHTRHSLNVKKRLDFEQICPKSNSIYCIISISIAVSNHETIYVYSLPLRIKNINDNPLKFSVNRTVIEIEENDGNWAKKAYPLPQAIDADGDLITYSLYLQNWNKPTGLFVLDQTNLSLKPLKPFDREQQNLYLLRLVAHNEHDKDVSIDIIVLIKDLNDNAPKCEHNHTIFYINKTDSISIYSINATDLDEGDNGKLEYNIINPISGFTIDHSTGQIRFDYTQWTRRNQSKLFLNITDHGKPIRLSTQCLVEFQFLFLFEINFTSIYAHDDWIQIEDVNIPIGKLLITDKQKNKVCVDCLIRLNSSLEDIFYLHEKTSELYLNLNSIVLIRILSNYMITKENLSLNMSVNVSDRHNPSIISTRTYSLNLNFMKDKLLMNSNVLFIKIQENNSLKETISIFNRFHYCLNNQSREFIINDPTNTFDMDNKLNLIVKKYLNVKQQQNYEVFIKELTTNQTDEMPSCSIQLRIHIYNPYSISNVYPYFSQSFYIVSSTNLSQFTLPSLPSYVKYISSKSNEISIDDKNGSIAIQSPSLFSSYSYDFHIQAMNSQTPSLTCSIPIRILFGINHQSPRLLNNLSKQWIEISSSATDFIYQIKAYDPDLSFDDQNKTFPPSIEYEIESADDDLQIERYTGRLFRKNSNQLVYNFTLVLTDFGQPNRLVTREIMTFYVKSDERLNRHEIPMIISTTFILISMGILIMIILLVIIILLLNCCHRHSSTNKSMANLSPTTPDSRLIDNEYVTTTTSLPRVLNREQRIYPTISNDNERKLLEQIHLPPPFLYSAEKVFIRPDYQQNLSMNDINKYLERFEKIYNNSSEHNCQEPPVGSVV